MSDEMVFPEGIPFYTPFVKSMRVKTNEDVIGILEWLDVKENVVITYNDDDTYQVEFLSFILRVEDSRENFPTAEIYDIM